MKSIGTLEQWGALSGRLSAAGYRIWQTQGDAQSPEGFRVWFMKPGKPDFEVATHNSEVHDAIIKYK